MLHQHIILLFHPSCPLLTKWRPCLHFSVTLPTSMSLLVFPSIYSQKIDRSDGPVTRLESEHLIHIVFSVVIFLTDAGFPTGLFSLVRSLRCVFVVWFLFFCCKICSTMFLGTFLLKPVFFFVILELLLLSTGGADPFPQSSMELEDPHGLLTSKTCPNWPWPLGNLNLDLNFRCLSIFVTMSDRNTTSSFSLTLKIYNR